MKTVKSVFIEKELPYKEKNGESTRKVVFCFIHTTEDYNKCDNNFLMGFSIRNSNETKDDVLLQRKIAEGRAIKGCTASVAFTDCQFYIGTKRFFRSWKNVEEKTNEKFELFIKTTLDKFVNNFSELSKRSDY